ncbi:MAG: S41 family peptidase [Bacteroidota bacterium]|nr:S41 family peptidase [Bacteroidota bacterium]
MKNANLLFILLISFYLGSLTTSCKKDSSGPNKASEIDQFIWYNMASYYLWADSVPKLSTAYFQNDTNKLNSFLAGYSDHKQLFSDLLYKYGTVDRFSWIESDYTTLQNELQGITSTMGMDFRLALLSDGSSIVGIVRYVFKNSPAEKAGIKRGSLFLKINGQQLTTSNYQSLLSATSFNMTLATVSNNMLYTGATTSTMTAVQMQENPVLLDSVYSVSNKKIGYLVYNGFYSDFDVQLNNVFAKFKTKGITDLVLDLRYNGGGSIQSAIYLASMIYGPYTSKTFVNLQFNKTLQDYYNQQYGSNFFVSNFIDTIGRTSTTPTTQINALNLSQLTVITSSGTASASELIINGLKPYMPVYIVGDTTVGKNVGSMTLIDYNHPTNKWAMQPIVMRLTNSLGKSDYSKGFVPNSTLVEDYTNLQPFGSLNDPLLSNAINHINGVAAKSYQISRAQTMGMKEFMSRKDMIPHANEMYFNPKQLKFKPNLLK